ncbi:hypothetical protein, partial [Paraburkholderia nemoris]|uniref:hypothetical protein n=1 Tax=Paraburkholderia nemoris TaxID=2793076 RepID=UPI001B8C37B3
MKIIVGFRINALPNTTTNCARPDPTSLSLYGRLSVPGKSVWIWLTWQPFEAGVADEVRGRPERSRGNHI